MNPNYKIFHWYSKDYNDSYMVDDKNNIIFADFCWKAIRTTDTGGVKLIYNGFLRNGNCTDYSGRSDLEIGRLINVVVSDYYYFSTDFDINSSDKNIIPKGDIKRGDELDSKIGRFMFQMNSLNDKVYSAYYMIDNNYGIAFYSNYGENSSIGVRKCPSKYSE